MPLYTMKEILSDAKSKKYGVGYYNCVSVEMVRAFVRASEDAKSPVIIGTAESLLRYCDFGWLAPIMFSAARGAKIPVAIHLDHAYSFDTVMKALRYGFGSVMFDGSTLPLEENIRVCAEISKAAHPMGAGLESELGKVGGLPEGGGTIGENQLTDAGTASLFIEKTDTDFLAVSIGTTHGEYKEPPNLDFDRLAEIRAKTEIPLVLHGGSGLTDDDFRKCIAEGVQKINIHTDIVTAAIEAIREHAGSLDYADLLQKTEEAIYLTVLEKIKVFGSGNMA